MLDLMCGQLFTNGKPWSTMIHFHLPTLLFLVNFCSPNFLNLLQIFGCSFLHSFPNLHLFWTLKKHTLAALNSLPCWDLNPGPPGTKQIAYYCATVLRYLTFTLTIQGSPQSCQILLHIFYSVF